MVITTYRGYRILAKPYQLRDDRRWTADLEIRRSGRRQPIGVTQRYASRQEVEDHCTAVARQFIDANVPGWPAAGPEHQGDRPARRTRHGKVGIMRLLFLAGLVLIAAGATVAIRGAVVTSRDEVLRVGDLSVTTEERHRLPAWVGGGVMLLGAVMVVAGLQRRR